MICGFGSYVESCLRVGSNKFYFFFDLEKKVRDFIVRFKGEIFSLRNFMKLFCYYNIIVLYEGSIFYVVF